MEAVCPSYSKTLWPWCGYLKVSISDSFCDAFLFPHSSQNGSHLPHILGTILKCPRDNGVIKIVIVINCNLITFFKIIESNCNSAFSLITIIEM